jgi:hypothetical protein
MLEVKYTISFPNKWLQILWLGKEHIYQKYQAQSLHIATNTR